MKNIENLITDFCENDMEKIFYFSLRKTGKEQEAEELTQEISLCILNALYYGTVPKNFNAWVWKIARNRYSKWAEKKHKKNEWEVASDIGDYELADKTTLENEYVHREMLSLLRRELAFISSEYRNIILAYYIQDKSIKEIAATLSLPIGTVTSKLFRARNILKEGMNMAREFGILSYKPENIDFTKNGMDGKMGEPWSIVSHRLYQNILLAAYRTPATAEELAIEVGVALPYMEDELDFLVKSTLMKKNGNKYETNILIISANAQKKAAEHLQAIIGELTACAIEALEYRTCALNARGVKWHEGTQAYEDMKWALLMKAADSIIHTSGERCKSANIESNSKIGRYGYTLRPNGGEWDLLGFEKTDTQRPFIGLHGGWNRVSFGQFKFSYQDIKSQTPVSLSDEETLALDAFINGKPVEKELLQKLAEYGYLKQVGNDYLPALAVYHGNPTALLTDEERKLYFAHCEKANLLGINHYMLCRDMIHREIPEFMKKEHHQISGAISGMFRLREAMLEEALRIGYISYSGGENEAKKRALGAYITIE